MTPFAAAVVVADGIGAVSAALAADNSDGQSGAAGPRHDGRSAGPRHDGHDDPNVADDGKLQPHDGDRSNNPNNLSPPAKPSEQTPPG
jgi:hypothetical protein